MKRKFFCAAIAVFALTFILSAGDPARAKFNATVSQVDTGGEMLYYQDNQPAARFFNNTLPAIFRLIFADEPFEATANNAVASVVRLINAGAFQAFAHSSIQVAPETFVYKGFTLTDMKAKSIFIDPSLANHPLNLTALPADTRLAFKCKVNFGHVFDMVYAELKASSDPKFQEIAAAIEQFKQAGFDIRQMCASVDGDIEILVTGTTLADAGIRVSIPDKNGSISLILKRMIPPADGDIVARIPSPIGEIIVLYQDGKITASNQSRLLKAPEATLAQSDGFQKLFKYVPDNGFGYFLLDIPNEVITQVRAAMDEEFQPIFDLLVKPCQLVSVFQVKNNGFYTVAASDFSFFQLAQSIQVGAIITPALIALPALNSARERARSVQCQNNMRQIGTAILMYSNDHNDQLPARLDQLKDYLSNQDELFECGIIYFGSPLKVSQVRNPGTLPIAVCPIADSDSAVVLMLDGHIENLYVGENNIIDALTENYSLDQETAAYISQKLNEQK